MTAVTLLAAWTIEAIIGWPQSIFRRIRHPVVWMGWLIARLDQLLNRQDWHERARMLAGAIAASAVILVSGLAAMIPATFIANGVLQTVFEVVIAASLLASRSLYQHVDAVAQALTSDSIVAARAAVAHIVGRDPAQLDEAGIARAALESLAENASDGVVAPLFWGVLLGLPGIAAYKAVNTLDSMIGHRNARYEAFGKFAARFDDAANWLPARITGVLFNLVGASDLATWKQGCRDARQHRSPNAGWPEAAMAGALQVRLCGPRRYGGLVANEPWLNADADDPNAASVVAGLRLYVRALGLAAMLLGLIAGIQIAT